MNCSKPGPGRQRAFAKLALLVMHGNIFVGLLSTELFFSDLGQEVLLALWVSVCLSIKWK